MSTVTQIAQTATRTTPVFPTTSLNAYEVMGLDDLSWQVQELQIELKGRDQTFEDRGHLRQIGWDLKRQHKSSCKGYAFVIDASNCSIIVPASWALQLPIETSEFRID